MFVRVVDEVDDDVLVGMRTNWEVVATHVEPVGPG